MADIYLDYAATTPLSQAAIDAMHPWLKSGRPHNPHSKHHHFGRAAMRAVELAKDQISNLLGVLPSQIVLTSGATEANMTVLGSLLEATGPKRIILPATEHVSMLAGLTKLAQNGIEIDLVPVSSHGAIDMAALEDRLRRPAGLVAAMAVNNETGVRHPIEAIADLCAETDTPFHCDATQALRLGGVPWTSLPDHVSIACSGHKIYGLMGIGALVLGRARQITPLILGGGQQNNLRSGSLPTLAVVGFGAAAEDVFAERDADRDHTQALDDQLLSLLKAQGLEIIADSPARQPGILSALLPNAALAQILPHMPHMALSNGAACSTETQRPSHVLTAMGYDATQINRSVRFSFGRFTTHDMISRAVHDLMAALHTLDAT